METMGNSGKQWETQAGPRQTKAVEHAIKDLNWAGRGEITLTGIIGKPETEQRSTHVLLLGGTVCDAAQTAKNEIGERYGWTITSSNYKNIVEDITAAIPAVKSMLPVIDRRITQEQQDENDAWVENNRREQEEKDAKRMQKVAEIKALMPAGAKALILAELVEDHSDAMTDYHGSSRTRTVAIGWRYSQKEDFRRLREVAATFPETAHLGPGADKRIEHRENYSMGAGNYLKDGYRHSNGWKVYSYSVSYLDSLYHDIELHLPDKGSDAMPESTGDTTGRVRRNVVKNGIEIHFDSKPDSETLSTLKSHGWRWARGNRCWYKRYSEAAEQFANSIAG